jgi:hypothetical protein
MIEEMMIGKGTNRAMYRTGLCFKRTGVCMGGRKHHHECEA